VTGHKVVLVSITTVVITSDSAGLVVATIVEETGGDETAWEVIWAEVVSMDETELVETAAEEVDSIPTALEVEDAAVSDTGQMVVETATETVVKTVERAGQLVTVSAQEMIVETKVVKTVDVVKAVVCEETADVTELVEEEATTDEVDPTTELVDKIAMVELVATVAEVLETAMEVVVALEEAGVVVMALVVSLVTVAFVDVEW
jgi:hypothetical protein